MDMDRIKQSKKDADGLVNYGFKLIEESRKEYDALYHDNETNKSENEKIKREIQSLKAKMKQIKSVLLDMEE